MTMYYKIYSIKYTIEMRYLLNFSLRSSYVGLFLVECDLLASTPRSHEEDHYQIICRENLKSEVHLCYLRSFFTHFSIVFLFFIPVGLLIFRLLSIS